MAVFSDWKDFNAHVAKTQLKDAPLAGMLTSAVEMLSLSMSTYRSSRSGDPEAHSAAPYEERSDCESLYMLQKLLHLHRHVMV